MPRNYPNKKVVRRKPSATKVPEKKSAGGLIYLITGLVIGLFIAFLVYLEEQPEDNAKKLAHPATQHINKKQTKQAKQLKQPKQKVTSKKTSSSRPTANNSKPKKQVPKYEFYTMLPDVEVEVNVPDIVQKKIAEKKQPQKTTTKKYKDTTTKVKSKKSPTVITNKTLYQLQVGAFASKSKAESMKGQLGFMGVQSSISSSLLSNGKKVYKVRIGPSSDEKKLRSIKNELKRMRINTFLQKL